MVSQEGDVGQRKTREDLDCQLCGWIQGEEDLGILKEHEVYPVKVITSINGA